MVIISVRDNCAGRYSPLALEQNIQTAKRGFRNAIINDQNNPESLYFTNPGDFDLYLLGEFDFDNGIVDAIEPECIYKGSTVMNEIQLAKLGEISD